MEVQLLHLAAGWELGWLRGCTCGRDGKVAHNLANTSLAASLATTLADSWEFLMTSSSQVESLLLFLLRVAPWAWEKTSSHKAPTSTPRTHPVFSFVPRALARGVPHLSLWTES